MKSFATLTFAIMLLSLAQVLQAQSTTYSWTGNTSTNYSDPTNWSPWRVLPMPTDQLTFSGGGEEVITGLPNQTIGSLSVTNNTSLVVSSTILNKVLTVSGSDFYIANGSSVTFENNNGVQISVEIGNATTVEVGGSLTIEKGVFDINNGTLILHSNVSPLRVANGGGFSIGTGGTLMFGKSGVPSVGRIVIADNTFSGNPAINRLIVNNADGAQLGNQPITITGEVNFIEGDLYTNNMGKLIFSPAANLPIENKFSKIIGYAEMSSRNVGTKAVAFLGYSIASGIDDLGNITIERATGPAGINFNDGHESIAATWDVNVDNQPVNGRNITMSWLSDFDNDNDIVLPMQMYRFTDGNAWEDVGGAAAIASNSNELRTSATVLTTHFSQWTLTSTDNALPVTLTNFGGTFKNGKVFLAWTTSSELNNDRFVIEKRVGNNYKYVGSVKGNGTTTEVNTYELVDNTPSAGNNIYRLTQIDLDGNSEVFDPITVTSTAVTDFAIYPNPSNGNELRVVMNTTDNTNTSIKLFNANGTVILQKNVGGLASVDVLEGKQLSRGLYYIEVSNGGAINKKRIIIN